MATTRTQLVRIGNSRGVRLPKTLIEQAGLEDDVELEVRGNTVVIAARRTAREGWADAARRMHAAAADPLLDPPQATAFDRDEWTW